jgi:chromosome partitioning protein
MKIAIFNLKGGTGKSTTCLNLGALLAKKRSTLLIDLDGQRTLTYSLGMEGKSPDALEWLMGKSAIEPIATSVKNLSLLTGNIGMFRLSSDRDLFAPAFGRLPGYDLVLLDCPPSLSIVSVQAILTSDRIILPVLCEPAALKGLSEAIELIKGESPDKPIAVLRVRHRKQLVLTREADQMLLASADELGYTLLHTVIPENIAIAESIAAQQPIHVYAPSSTGAKAYKALTKEVIKLWG